MGHVERQGRPAPGCARLLAERGVVALGSDGNNDTAPSTTEGIGFPIHALALNAMGVDLLDYLQLEGLAGSARGSGRWEFLFTAAPLRIPGGNRLAAEPDRGPLRRMIGERTIDGVAALTLASRRGRRDRGGVRAGRGNDRLLSAPPRQGAARATRRPGQVRGVGLQHGDPAAAPLGEPARRPALFGGGRAHRRARPRRHPRCASTPTACRSTASRTASPRLGGGPRTRRATTEPDSPRGLDWSAARGPAGGVPVSPTCSRSRRGLPGRTLTIETEMRETGGAPVPVVLRLPPLCLPPRRAPGAVGGRAAAAPACVARRARDPDG